MEQIQGHYDSWFESELKQNFAVYGIEILGGEDEVIVEEDPDEIDESGLGELKDDQVDKIDEGEDVENMDFEER